jgi:hypothetical protein
VLTIAHLAPSYRGRVLVPVLGKVRSTKVTDRVPVLLVSGQAALARSPVPWSLLSGSRLGRLPPC